QIGEAVLDGVAGIDDLTRLPGGPAGDVEGSESVGDRARPENGHFRREGYRRPLSREPLAVGNPDRQPGKALALLEPMEDGPQDERESRESNDDGAADAVLQAQLREPADHHPVEILVDEIG